MFSLLVFLLAAFLLTTSSAVTVHLVPHTHDDVGWLKTVDEYFSGTNNTIQHAAVRNVLNAVFMSLSRNPERRFTYVEQAFFQRWWRELSERDQAATRALVHSGQLNFVNGGWCMHDEAATHYVDMIDQTTLGHRLLKDAFGDDGVVTVGWQLDPFGHSATQAALLSAETGFDGLFFGRIDYQDLDLRHKEKRNEFIWRASPSLGDDSQIFAGLTGEYGGNYGPPGGFNWNGNDEPIETNKNLATYNVPSRVEDAVNAALNQANMTRGENIMWTMGSDFNYEDAEVWFTNMDKLIEVVNADGRINMRYSSPAEYVAAKKAEKNVTWPVTTDDFFPYADGPHQFWSGYFTSRPALKGYVRTSSGLFSATRTLQSVAGTKDAGLFKAPLSELNLLEEALGVAQHHDAVSGTAKQHVAFDYARRISIGVSQATQVLSQSVSSLVGKSGTYDLCLRLNETVCSTSAASASDIEIVLWNSLGRARTELITIPVRSSTVTVTGPDGKTVSSQAYAAGETLTNYERDTNETDYVVSFLADLPPMGLATYSLNVQDVEKEVSDESILVDMATQAPAALENEFLKVDFSPNGLIESLTNKETGVSVQLVQSFCYYTSNEGDKSSGQRSGAYIFRPKEDATCYPIETAEGGADIITTVSGGVVSEVRQRFSDWLTQTVRLPTGARHVDFEFTVGAIPFQSTTANKTLQKCESWRQTGNCDPNGPREPQHDLPCNKPVPGTASGYCECFGGRKAELSGCGHTSFTCEQACYFTEGREVVSKFQTNIASNKTLFTDSNGREMLRRVRDHRTMWNLTQTEEVAGNYYPINSAAAITDGKTAQLTLLVDRASGVGSIVDGEMEVMIHRRILKDDGRGVGEPLNETRDTYSYATKFGGQHAGPGLVIRGTHKVTLEAPATAASVWRPLADRAYLPPVLLVRTSDADSSAPEMREKSYLSAGLPDSLHLLTLQALSPTELLVRVSHQYGIGEDAKLSQPVQIDVSKILDPDTFQVVSVREVSLTNSMDKSSIMKRRARNLEWNTEGDRPSPHPWRQSYLAPPMVTLGPLEIKTFVFTVKSA